MCATCGFPAAPGHWTEAGFGPSPHERVRARFRRMQVLQSILPAFGFSAHDSIQTPGIVLANLTGSQVIVADLAELWTAAERLGRQRIDPLDPRFIGAPAVDAA
ncbi:MAG: hypothetical protein H0T75_21495 [Rhizobiales bacterium]|nr:hypothetical protein [Hyphomicrobiales bacterium]